MENNSFLSPSGKEFSAASLVRSIAKFVYEAPDGYYRIVIGTDSEVKKKPNHEVDFVTAIIVHRVGTGAKYFWNKKKIRRKMVLRDRIYQETQTSLQLAQAVVPKIREAISLKYDFEIHVDVGPNGATREMIKEVVGMVQGYGFTAKTKPESWGASSVADKYA